MQKYSEKREYERFDIEIEAQIINPTKFLLKTKNISAKGSLFHNKGEVDLPIGENINIIIEFSFNGLTDGQKKKINLEGVIVRKSTDSFAVKFSHDMLFIKI